MAVTPASDALPPTPGPRVPPVQGGEDTRMTGMPVAEIPMAPASTPAPKPPAPFVPSSAAERDVVAAARAPAPGEGEVEASRQDAVTAQDAVPSFFSRGVTGVEARGRFVNAASSLLDPFRDQIGVSGIDPTKDSCPRRPVAGGDRSS
jgi:hypothetical protein